MDNPDVPQQVNKKQNIREIDHSQPCEVIDTRCNMMLGQGTALSKKRQEAKATHNLDIDMKFQNIQICGQTVDEWSKTVIVRS